MLFAAHAIRILAAGVETFAEQRVVAERERVQTRGLFRNLEQADAFDRARGAGEILVDERLLQADRLEDLRATIGLIGRDAHLGHHFVEALANRLDVALLGFFRIDLGDDLGELGERLEREIRVDRLGAVACEQCELVYFARRARLDDEARRRAQALLHQMLMHCARRKQRGNRKHVCRHAPV